MTFDGHTITFSSGRTLPADCGIIGLSMDPFPCLYTGFSGRKSYSLSLRLLDPADVAELATYMVGQWGTVHADALERFDARLL